jgi:hypothetical protein
MTIYLAGAPAFHPVISSPALELVLFRIYPPVIQTSRLWRKKISQ